MTYVTESYVLLDCGFLPLLKCVTLNVKVSHELYLQIRSPSHPELILLSVDRGILTFLPLLSGITRRQHRRTTHYAVGHQGSLHKTRQHISGVVLVVRDAGQARVERHHDEGELGQRAQQASSGPSEARLQVKLDKTRMVRWRNRNKLLRI